jgi:hypothetical protein
MEGKNFFIRSGVEKNKIQFYVARPLEFDSISHDLFYKYTFVRELQEEVASRYPDLIFIILTPHQVGFRFFDFIAKHIILCTSLATINPPFAMQILMFLFAYIHLMEASLSMLYFRSKLDNSK